MRIGKILLCAVLLLLATGVSAQFSLSTVEPGAELQLPPNINRVSLETEVINSARARAMRKARWRQRNLIDTRISLTGSLTQYNDAWSNNGGQNAVSGLVQAYYYHTYEKNRYVNTFKFDGQYGMNFVDEIWFKNQDYFKLYHLSSWKLKQEGALKNWAYSFEATFSSQFAKGYENRTSQDVLWSNFLSPATLNGGLGLTYTSPNPKLPFVITISPVSGNILFVLDDSIPPSRRQNLGIPVTYADEDTDQRHPIYKNSKAEGGSNLKISFNRTFEFGQKKGVSLQYNTDLTSFYGWITQIAKHDPDNAIPTIYPTVNWTNAVNFNPWKFLTFQFTTRTVYDKSQVDKVQMQYFLSLGLSYSFKNK